MGNAFLCVSVCAPSQRQPPARPSFASSPECASSSGTPSLKRALWRSRPLKSYRVQTHTVTLILPRGKLKLTCIESVLIWCFSGGTPQGSYESSCDSYTVQLAFCMRCPLVSCFSTLYFTSRTKVQLTDWNSVSNRKTLCAHWCFSELQKEFYCFRPVGIDPVHSEF